MRSALAILLLCGAGVANATPVTLVFSGESSSELQVTAQRLDAGDVAPVVVKTKSDAQPQLDLAPGHWSIRAEGADVWHSEQPIFVTAEPAGLQIPLLPAGFISGTVTTKSGIETPSELLIRTAPASGEMPCAIVEKSFRCKVPAGVVDLRVRATTMVPRYYSEIAVERGKTTDLGKLLLERGASLSGTVVVAGEARDVRVSASSALGRYLVGTGKQGHFHIDGLVPGRYRIVATAAKGKLTSDELEVEILADRLAELRDPLLVEAPKRMRLTVTPPLDPWGEPWNIELQRLSRGNDEELVAKTAASESGEWNSPALRSGRYRLDAGPHRGGTWVMRELEMSGESLDLPLQLGSEKITGTVSYGDRALPGSIAFRSEGMAFIEVETDAEGRYETALPQIADAKWSAVVTSEHPPVRRTFENVVPRGTVDLHVPLTMISGIVLDADGKPVEHALVNIRAPHEPLVQASTDADGWFTAVGLATGEYRVHAHGFLVESEVQIVQVTDDLTPDPIQLVLRDVEKVAGRILSEGGPVPGARVLVYATDVVQEMMYAMPTDERGVFGSWAPPGAREIEMQIIAPGFDYRMFRTAIPGRMIDVPVRQEGGAISVPAERGDLVAVLQHNGAWAWVRGLVSQGFGTASAGKLIVGPMEPGPYLLCYVGAKSDAELRRARFDQSNHCTAGFLPPHGSLEFAPPRVLTRAAAPQAAPSSLSR